MWYNIIMNTTERGVDILTIKEIRTQTGLSQSKFAKHLGIPVKTIQSWEQGLRQPPDYIINLIERVLKYEKMI